MFETKSHRDVFTDSTSAGAESASVTETLPAHGQHPASKRGEQPATSSLRQHTARETGAIGSRIEAVGRELVRYGLVVAVAWIGLMKFTAYEAEGISPFVANSPLMSWVYHVMSVRGFSALLGVVEVAVALLIAAGRFSPRAGVVGSALAVGMFLITLSFMLTTPGVWEPTAGGFPALSAVPGQFLIKDLVLLGISVLTLGEAWRAATRNK